MVKCFCSDRLNFDFKWISKKMKKRQIGICPTLKAKSPKNRNKNLRSITIILGTLVPKLKSCWLLLNFHWKCFSLVRTRILKNKSFALERKTLPWICCVSSLEAAKSIYIYIYIRSNATVSRRSSFRSERDSRPRVPEWSGLSVWGLLLARGLCSFGFFADGPRCILTPLVSRECRESRCWSRGAREAALSQYKYA